MTAVWDRGRQYAKGELLVLLAMADWAKDDGSCYPSIPQIAEKARLTERQVYGVLKRLRADGVVTSESGGGRGRLTVYRIHVENLNPEKIAGNKRLPSAGEAREGTAARGKRNPENISGFEGRGIETGNPEISDTETLKSATRNPEISYIPPDPLIGRTVREPSGEPSVKASPYPLASERVKTRAYEDKSKTARAARVDAMSFGRFRAGLKQSLDNAPLNHKNFSEVVRGERDWMGCFREWIFAGWEGTRVVTESSNPQATRRGLEKYRKRVEALMQWHLGAVVELEVREAPPPAAVRAG